MEREMKLFNEYVKKFDLTNKKIRYKFHHSYRVMEMAKEIATSLKLNEEDTYIATLAALLHDIGRFNQIKKYDTYRDQVSTDHGDEGERVLKENDFIREFNTDEKTIDIILKSTKYHNKYEIDSDLDEKTTLICKIVRDADKLDIIRECSNEINDKEIIIKEEILDSIKKHELASNNYCENDTDHVVYYLSWIVDFNFKYSYLFLDENKIIEKKLNLLEMYGETEKTKLIREIILNKLKEEIKC